MAANGKFTEAQARRPDLPRLGARRPLRRHRHLRRQGDRGAGADPGPGRLEVGDRRAQAVLRHLPVRRAHAGRRAPAARRASAASSCSRTAGTPRRPSSPTVTDRDQEGATSRSTSSPWPSRPRTRPCSSRSSDAGGGSVISADRPAGPRPVFADEAQSLAKQILVTATPPAGAARKAPCRSPSTPAARATPTPRSSPLRKHGRASAAAHRRHADRSADQPVPDHHATSCSPGCWRSASACSCSWSSCSADCGKKPEGLVRHHRALHPQGRGKRVVDRRAARRDRPGRRDRGEGAREQPQASRSSSATSSRPAGWRSSRPSGCCCTRASRSARPRSLFLITGGSCCHRGRGLPARAYCPLDLPRAASSPSD